MSANNILDQQINSNMVILSIVGEVHSTGTICYGLGDRWYCLVIGGIVSSVVILAGKSSFQKIEVPYRPLLISITPSVRIPTVRVPRGTTHGVDVHVELKMETIWRQVC